MGFLCSRAEQETITIPKFQSLTEINTETYQKSSMGAEVPSTGRAGNFNRRRGRKFLYSLAVISPFILAL